MPLVLITGWINELFSILKAVDLVTLPVPASIQASSIIRSLDIKSTLELKKQVPDLEFFVISVINIWLIMLIIEKNSLSDLSNPSEMYR